MKFVGLFVMELYDLLHKCADSTGLPVMSRPLFLDTIEKYGKEDFRRALADFITQEIRIETDNGSENPEKVDFTAFGDGNKTSSTKNKIDMLLDVELEVTVELGRKKMSIQEVLKLGKGSVIELTKLAGEPIDIYVNQRKLAEGEVVVVDENFAIRITSLVEQSERLQSLG